MTRIAPLRRLFFDEVGRWRRPYYLLLAGPRQLLTERWVRRLGSSAKRVLDVGSRRSPYTRSLRSQVVCVDIPSDTGGYLGFTEKLANQLNRLDNYHLVYGDACSLPFKETSFDLVLCFEVIEHVPNPEAAIGGMARVLNRDGMLLLTTPNGVLVPCENPYHHGHFSQQSLSAALRSHFHDVRVSTWCPFPEWTNRLHRLWMRYQKTRRLRSLIVYALTRLCYLILAITYRNVEGTVLVAEARNPLSTAPVIASDKKELDTVISTGKMSV